MANPFGDVVDDEKLDGMARYVNKLKTQKDRAREAMNLINENDKNSKAANYVENVKSYYGNGVTTLCEIYNATGDTLYYVTDKDWYGFIGQTPYPTEIGNGQWVSFLHVHETGSASGSEAAVVYRGKNKDGNDRDYLIGWSTPWSAAYSNTAYSEIGGVGSFEARWDDIYDQINKSSDHHITDSDGVNIETVIANGTSPVFNAILKIPYNP